MRKSDDKRLRRLLLDFRLDSGTLATDTRHGYAAQHRGDVTSAGWQVTLCDHMWHVSSRSGVATLRTAIHLLLVTATSDRPIGTWLAVVIIPDTQQQQQQQQQQQPFNGCLIRDNPGRPVPEETFTHSHPSWSTYFLYHLSPFATVHGILFIQLTCLTVLSYNLFPGPLWS